MKALPRIIFLSVPESLRGHVENSFSIDPNIPIPVEIPDAVSPTENFNLEELSWEMIVSGMLRVIAAGKEEYPDFHENLSPHWVDYYRHFVLAVRPSIMGEFTEAAILKARNGDFDLALEILDTLRGLFPSSPVVLLNRALVMEEKASTLERSGNATPSLEGDSSEAIFEAAEDAYTTALALDPPFPDIPFNAGFFYLGRKDFRRAKECFSLFLSIAEDREKMERAQTIIKDIDKNSLEDIRFGDAYKFIQQGNEEQGLRSIREFIEQHPSVWNGWFVLGWALRRLGRWKDGISAFGKAIELGGGNSDTHNELAICLMELGDLHGARRELEIALHDDPENVKIISNMGVLAMKNGNKDEATAFFRTVLELAPDDPLARKIVG
jgi:Flp pilus assembly protein TadD